MSTLLRLRARLSDGQPAFGVFLNLGSPVACELAGIAGFDWAVIDLEHGSGSEADLLAQVYALELRGVVPIVRVEANDRPRFSFALDKGALGIMVPRIDDAAEAAVAVGHLRYPPGGSRGVAILNRATDFGRRADEVIPGFNHEVLGIVQVETTQAVDAAEEIAAEPGVEVLFVGPADLAHSLGIPRDLDHPLFRAAIGRVVVAAHKAGKVAGVLVPTPEAAQRHLEDGMRFIAVGSDSSHMLAAMAGTLSVLQATGH